MKAYKIMMVRAGSEAREVEGFELLAESAVKAEESVLQFLPENVVCVRAVEVRCDQAV